MVTSDQKFEMISIRSRRDVQASFLCYVSCGDWTVCGDQCQNVIRLLSGWSYDIVYVNICMCHALC